MKICLTLGDDALSGPAEQFMAAWLKVAPGDSFTVVPGQPSLVNFRTSGLPFSSVIEEVDATLLDGPGFGLLLRERVEKARVEAGVGAVRPHLVFLVQGFSPQALPDAGFAALNAFVTGVRPHSCTCGHGGCGGSGQWPAKPVDDNKFYAVVDAARQELDGVDVTFLVNTSKHVTGLDGTLSQPYAEVTDQDIAYQHVRTVSAHLRYCYNLGGQARVVAEVSPQVSLPVSSLMDVVSGGRVEAGKLAGGALWGGALEVLYRLGVRVKTASHVLDATRNYRQLLEEHDLLVALENSLHEWTYDHSFISRLSNANAHVGRAVLVVTPQSSMGRREAANSHIDGVYIADQAQQLSDEPVWVEAGRRCATSWSPR